ncbi:CBM96 family carbohydrate-binding protein [Bacillus weihaiensis]|uniref:CBM96 family carbohydrate-binding protein n=1 Tax=Bacillus weihaiensis TaxID=1547283 RepID=UPI00235344EF|nr:DNRLRE domain-containing protein [Bacillus weihaiensis]
MSIVFNKKINLILCLVLVFHLLPVVSTVSANEATKLDIKSVDASGHDGNFPENTLDDNLETRWSAQGEGQWISYNLGTPQKVGYLGIAFSKGDSRQSSISIEMSNDGEAWKEVYSQSQSSGTTLGMEVFDIEDTEGQYVRIVGYGNSSNDWNSVTVVQIYAPLDDGSTPLYELVPPKEEEREDVTYTEPGLINPDGSVHQLHSPNPVTGTVHNVLDFGADSQDNNHDDLPAILDAIEAASAGDEVYLPDGIYNLNSTLSNDGASHFNLKTGVNIRGESREGTVLVSSFSNEPNGKVMRAFGQHDIHISDLTVTSSFDGEFSTNHSENNPDASGPEYGIYIADGLGAVPSYNITIEDVTVEHFQTMGVRIQNSHDVVVTDSLFRKATDVGGGGAGYGVSIQGTAKTDRSGYQNDTRYNVVKDSVFEGPYIRHGVLLQFYAHNNLIINNTLTNTVLDAIDLHGEDEYLNVIEENTISGVTKGAGIALGNTGGSAPSNHDNSGPGNVILNNHITNSREGIKIHMGSPDTLIEGNIISDTTNPDNSKGILLMNAPGTVVKNNTIQNNSADNFWGVSFEYDNGDSNANNVGSGKPSNISLSGNTITGNTNGVRILDGENLTIDDTNTIRNNTGQDLVDNRITEPNPVEPPADAEIVEIEVIEDALIRDGQYAGENYSNETKLKVKERGPGNDYRRQSLFKFDKSQVGEEIVAAKLQVYNLSLESATKASGGYHIKAQGLSDDTWSENTVTFANHPQEGGVDSEAVFVDTDSAYVELDVTDFVLSQTDDTLSFRLVGIEDNQGADYASKEHSENKPAKLVLYTKAKSEIPDLDGQEFTAVEDALIRDGAYASENYGNADKLKIKERAAGNDYRRQAIVKFHTAELTGDVEQAVLKLYNLNLETKTASSGGYHIQATGVEDDSWEETTVTFANAPEGSVQSDEVFVGQDDSYILIDVTQFVKEQKDNIVSFRIKGIEDDEGADFASKEHESMNAPMLVISTSNEEPEPTIDVTELLDLIASAKAITNKDGTYTNASFEALIDAIVAAEAAQESIETENELQLAISALQAAIDGLEEVQDSDDQNKDVITKLGQTVQVYPNKTVSLENTAVKIALPEDLPQGTKLTIEKKNLSNTSAQAIVLAGDEYTFTFDFPAGMESYTGTYLLTLGYDANAYNSDEVAIYYFNETNKEWEFQGGDVDYDTITLEVNHFSTYGVFAKVQENPEEPEDSSDPGDKETPNDSDKQEDSSDEDEKEELIDPVEKEESSNQDEKEESNDPVQKEKSTNQDHVLPATATNVYNYLLIGLALMVIGGTTVLFTRRKDMKIE